MFRATVSVGERKHISLERIGLANAAAMSGPLAKQLQVLDENV